MTLTLREGDTGEQRFTLRLTDVSRLAATSTGWFNPQSKITGERGFALRLINLSRLVATTTRWFDPCSKLVDHLGGAGVAIKQEGTSRRLVGDPQLSVARVFDIQPTGTSCWPPVGECTSCGFAPGERLETSCIAHGKWCNKCGHIARACITETNLHAATGGGAANQKENSNPPPGVRYSQASPEVRGGGEEPGKETRCSRIVIGNDDTGRDRTILFGDGDLQRQRADHGTQAERIHPNARPNDMKVTRGRDFLQVPTPLKQEQTRLIPNTTKQLENDSACHRGYLLPREGRRQYYLSTPTTPDPGCQEQLHLPRNSHLK